MTCSCLERAAAELEHAFEEASTYSLLHGGARIRALEPFDQCANGVWVPREPTEAILDAIYNAHPFRNDVLQISEDEAKAIYADALAASPQPPAAAKADTEKAELVAALRLYRESHNVCIEGQRQGRCNKCRIADALLDRIKEKP